MKSPPSGDGELFIGLMSGTSLDGVDGVLVDFAPTIGFQKVLGHVHCSFEPRLRGELLALNSSGPDELHRAAQATQGLARACSEATHQLLAQCGVSAREVRAIGVHGQTVRHQPDLPAGAAYTLQLDPSPALGEATGIDTVSDFRSQDVAAGGQGAPLVPIYHQAVFARPGHLVAVVNLGGMANVSLLDGTDGVLGFDTGPGNVLLDGCMQSLGGLPFDRDGDVAARGQVCEPLLGRLLEEPYFTLPPPKSTGRELFSMEWLQARLCGLDGAGDFGSLPLPALMATLCELTALTVSRALRELRTFSPPLLCGHPPLSEVWVCGGGAYNRTLLHRLQALLPSAPVRPTDEAGLPADEVEACAFAWLARERLAERPTTLSAVTGAIGPRIAGAHRIARAT